MHHARSCSHRQTRVTEWSALRCRRLVLKCLSRNLLYPLATLVFNRHLASAAVSFHMTCQYKSFHFFFYFTFFLNARYQSEITVDGILGVAKQFIRGRSHINQTLLQECCRKIDDISVYFSVFFSYLVAVILEQTYHGKSLSSRSDQMRLVVRAIVMMVTDGNFGASYSLTRSFCKILLHGDWHLVSICGQRCCQCLYTISGLHRFKLVLVTFCITRCLF